MNHRTLFFLLFMAIGAAPTLSQSFYFGLNAGLFFGEHISAEFHTEFGKRWKDKYGLGIAYTGSLDMGTSVSYGITAAGLQGRLELNRWLFSLDAGSVLGVRHSTDWYCNQEYQPAFDPYFRPAVSYRFGGLTLGASSFFTTPLRFTEYDEEVNMEEPDICYGREYLESFQRFTLTLGINVPSRNRKKD
ncbi:MAG: hypothetical protein H6556_03685 [Lewinellaceae bacterium]|nr:hypothetical protein [Lewinellaceae bacterium]